MLLSIDGVQYDVSCEVHRIAAIESTDISGYMLDRSYFNDVRGTYFSYELVFKHPLYNQNTYASLYEALTEPVDGHVFVLPYNGSTLTLTARVETVPDDWKEMDDGRTFWMGTRVEILPNYPTKVMELEEVIAAGRTPMPDIANPNVGDTYTWDGDEWVPAQTYTDADNIAY